MVDKRFKELIKKEYDKLRRSKKIDDFDTVWDIRDASIPIPDNYFEPKQKDVGAHTYINLENIHTKSKLLKVLDDVNDDDVFDFVLDDEDNVIEIAISNRPKETESDVAFRIAGLLESWAILPSYKLWKELYMVKKENQELKQKLDIVNI